MYTKEAIRLHTCTVFSLFSERLHHYSACVVSVKKEQCSFLLTLIINAGYFKHVLSDAHIHTHMNLHPGMQAPSLLKAYSADFEIFTRTQRTTDLLKNIKWIFTQFYAHIHQTWY